MDPDKTLEELRDALQRIADWQTGLFPRPDLDEAMDDATDAFSALDGWLRRGGFLPQDWNRGRD